MSENITLVIGDGGQYPTGKSYHIFQSLLNDLKQGKSSLICDMNDEYRCCKNKELPAINRVHKTTDISLSYLDRLDYSTPKIHRILPTSRSLDEWQREVNQALSVYKGHNIVLDYINRYTTVSTLDKELSNLPESVENIFMGYQNMARFFNFPLFDRVNKIRLHSVSYGISYCKETDKIFKYKELILNKEQQLRNSREKYIEFKLD